MASIGTITIHGAHAQVASKKVFGVGGGVDENRRAIKAPIATSGDKNVYVNWWSNKTGNDEVMFKVSTDAGKTFGSKINLSNSPKSESQNAQIWQHQEVMYMLAGGKEMQLVMNQYLELVMIMVKHLERR